MARKTFIDIKLETINEWKKYYERPKTYAGKIKNLVKKHDEKAKVMFFGSLVKGKMKPDSDIDVLIITKLAGDVNRRIKLRMEISKEIGECTPFEIHIVTPEEYENWYKRFIDEHVEI
ncbi:MAG: nucleotidyltransferase domain-containing protein [Candidatus Asgardarchaeum sp.]